MADDRNENTRDAKADILEELDAAAMRVAIDMEVHAALSTTTRAKGDVIALALLAVHDTATAKERERCARITEKIVIGGYLHGYPEWADGHDIAAAIRKGDAS